MLVDTNVWVAISITTHPSHRLARDWFAAQKEKAAVFFCRATQQSFLRLITTEIVMRSNGVPPLSNENAWAIYETYISDSRVSFLDEPKGVQQVWQALAVRAKASPKLWMDAYLAAFAIAGKQQFVTLDQAFTQFQGLKVLVLS
jgi:toxin-antitoxin system PIN domain toxin